MGKTDTASGESGANGMRTWLMLSGLSLVLIALFMLIRLPAPVLLGAMFAAAILATRGRHVALPKPVVSYAQGLLGLLIAQLMPPSIWTELAADWWLILTVIIAVIVLSYGIGWVLARRQVLPGTTAIWGASPGAASAIILMSEQSDADPRLVAFMQYLRVIMVASVASLIARLVLGADAAPSPLAGFLTVPEMLPLAESLAIAAAGMVVTRMIGIPAINMILPMIVAIALQAAGLVTIALPPALLAAAYVVFGWTVGMRFRRDIVRHAFRALPTLFAATALLMALCAGLALILAKTTGMDLLTAYLATSPGGADAIAIIAAAAPVNKPFVLAVQTLRFILILLIGPALSRLLASRFAKSPGLPS